MKNSNVEQRKLTLMLKRKNHVYICAALATLAILLSYTNESSAQPVPIATCTGTHSVEYSPGLTNTTTATLADFQSNFFSCIHVLQPPLLMPGTSQAQTIADLSCNDLLVTGSVTRDIEWSNGETSTINYIYSVSYLQGNLTVTYNGTVNSGRYSGGSLVGLAELTPYLEENPVDMLTACNTPEGITSLSGVITFEFLP